MSNYQTFSIDVLEVLIALLNVTTINKYNIPMISYLEECRR